LNEHKIATENIHDADTQASTFKQDFFMFVPENRLVIITSI